MGGLETLSRGLRGKRAYLWLALSVVILDQWTKWWVETELTGRGPLVIIPKLLNFVYVRNTGVAFGLFPAGGDLLGTVVLSLLGLGGFSLLAVYFLRTPTANRMLLAALALVLGGAVGNLADRIAQGAVTDFVDFYVGRFHWYTFNVADSAITIGIVMMAGELLLPDRPDAGPEPPAEDDAPSDGAPAPGP